MQVTIDSVCFRGFKRPWQRWRSPPRSWQGCPNSDSVRKFSHHGHFAGSSRQGDCPHSLFPHSPRAWWNLYSSPAKNSPNVSPVFLTPSFLFSFFFSFPPVSPFHHLSIPPFSHLPSLYSLGRGVQNSHNSPEREVGFIDKPGCFSLK